MEAYSIYFHHPDYEGIVSTVKNAFPKAKIIQEEEEGGRSLLVEIKGGLFSRKESLTIKYRQRVNPSYNLQGAECPMLKQVRGMYNFVASLPATDAQLQSLMLGKIPTINAEATFICEPKLTDGFRDLLRQVTNTCDAFVFAQPGSSLSQSVHQQFLDKDFNLLIDTQGNCGNGHIKVEISSRYFDDQRPPSQEQEQRKERSEKILSSKGILINSHLPYSAPPEEMVLKSKQAIIERAYALALIAAKGEGVPQEQLERVKQTLPVTGLSPQENYIYEKAELAPQEQTNAIWRYESLNVLMWVLGFLDSLAYPSQICDVPVIVDHILNQSRQDFEARATVRSKEEILDETDLVYRMHWACVQARLKGQEPGGELNPSVIYERHYALNWLCAHRDDNTQWDDVTTDT